jgi:hypothetical protein
MESPIVVLVGTYEERVEHITLCSSNMILSIFHSSLERRLFIADISQWLKSTPRYRYDAALSEIVSRYTSTSLNIRHNENFPYKFLSHDEIHVLGYKQIFRHTPSSLFTDFISPDTVSCKVHIAADQLLKH